VLSECVHKIFRQNFFIEVSATKSWKKSRNFRYGSSGDFLSKGQKTVGVGLESTPPGPYRVKERNISICSHAGDMRLSVLGKLLIPIPVGKLCNY